MLHLRIRPVVMQVSVFHDMRLCTDEEVARLLPLVSAQRREQALRFRHTFGRFACLKSYLMLAELLSVKGELPDFSYNQYGKPQLAGVEFSISHCRNAIAVAVNDTPVGIDVECFRSADSALVDRTMNSAEAEAVYSAERPEEMFAMLWTRKEAVLKCRGTGIVDDLHSVLLGEEHVESLLDREHGYALSTAVGSICKELPDVER